MPNSLHDICGAALAGRTLTAGEALEFIPLLSSRLPAVMAAVGLISWPERFTCGYRTATLGSWDCLGFAFCASGTMVGDFLTEKGGPFKRDLALTRDRIDLDRGAHVPG